MQPVVPEAQSAARPAPAHPKLNLDTIQAPIADELVYFEQHFRGALTTRVGLLDRIMQYIVRRKGKQMRPMFVLLTAELCGGIRPATYRAAALIELLHTATLIHDDVVDDADERRGFFSLNALWKNKIAVLVGDFLLSRGLLMSLENGDYDLLRVTSKAVKLMSEGELLQMEKSRTLNIDEPVYFDIIRQKTASLIASCTESGALSAGADAVTVERLRQFGELVGMAFQIKDDLFDYGAYTDARISGAKNSIGKPTGTDLKEKKITLPLIHTLNQASWIERRRLIGVVKARKQRKQDIQFLVSQVEKFGGLTYSFDLMHRYAADALAILDTFPASPARESLRGLVQYTLTREK